MRTRTARLCARLTRFEGRIGRADFWTGSIAVALGVHLAGSAASTWNASGEIAAFLAMAALYPWAALAAARGADRGRPRLYGPVLVAAVMLAGLAERALPAPWAGPLGWLSGACWLVLLFDLGLGPGRAPVAARRLAAKPALWTPSTSPPSPIPPIRSR